MYSCTVSMDQYCQIPLALVKPPMSFHMFTVVAAEGLMVSKSACRPSSFPNVKRLSHICLQMGNDRDDNSWENPSKLFINGSKMLRRL